MPEPKAPAEYIPKSTCKRCGGEIEEVHRRYLEIVDGMFAGLEMLSRPPKARRELRPWVTASLTLIGIIVLIVMELK